MESKCPRCKSVFDRLNRGAEMQFACKTILAANGNIRYRSPKCADLERVMWESRVASLTADLAAAKEEVKRLTANLKVEKLRLIESILNEAEIAHRKCGQVATSDENFQLGRHGGLMWAYNAVCHAALLAQPEKEAGDALPKL